MEPLFHFRALDRQGVVTSGKIRASDVQSATRELQAQGLTPLRVQAPGNASSPSTWAPARRAGRPQLQGLLQELSTLLGAGVSLADSIPALASTYGKGPLAAPMAVAIQRLRAGSTLSGALDQPSLPWPAYVLALLRAGEASGEMAQALQAAAAQMEYEMAVSRDVRTALVYPLTLVTAGIAAVLIILVGVVPRFAAMLRSSRADVPEFSRWVIGAGVWMQQNLTIVLIVTAAAVAGIVWALRERRVRQALLEMMAGWPLLGPWLRRAETGRWALVFGALLANRVPIVDALKISAGTVQVKFIREGLSRGCLQLQQGRPVSDVLERQEWFPEVRLSLVRVGERAGELPRMLHSLGELETQAARTLQKRVLALIEPVAILLIGVVIGVIMVAVMMAITSLNTAIG
jgi:general secretion pathway protein F